MKTEESQRSIKDWMKVFRELYSEADSQRTPEQMWVAVMAHTSSIGESIRKATFESLLKSAAHTFCWLCSFVNKCNSLQDDIFSIKESLCEIVCLKYPHKCGLCKKAPCQCDPLKMEEKPDKSAEYVELLDLRKRVLDSFESFSIDDFKKVFNEIYGGRIHIQTLESIGFHFLEEIGEAAICVRKLSQLRGITQDNSTKIDSAFLNQLTTVEGIVKNYVKHRKPSETIDSTSTDPRMLRARIVEAKIGLVVEIGDSFSWFCSILNKLDSISKSIFNHPKKHPKIKPLERVLNDVYFDNFGNARCYSCKKNPCKCVFYNLTTENQYRRVTVPLRKKGR